MAATGFEVTLTPYMLTCGSLILGLVQMLKDLPIVNRLRDWLPFLPMAMAVGFALADGWPAPLLNGVALGLLLTGGYKVANAPSTALAKRNGKGGTPPK